LASLPHVAILSAVETVNLAIPPGTLDVRTVQDERGQITGGVLTAHWRLTTPSRLIRRATAVFFRRVRPT
jgi:hypothetical protein